MMMMGTYSDHSCINNSVNASSQSLSSDGADANDEGLGGVHLGDGQVLDLKYLVWLTGFAVVTEARLLEGSCGFWGCCVEEERDGVMRWGRRRLSIDGIFDQRGIT